MSWFRAGIDSLANNYQYAVQKFRTPDKAPRYISTEVEPFDFSSQWQMWSLEKRQRVAARISWIYSNVFRIGNELTAAKFNVYKKGSQSKDIMHPLEEILQQPNEFFTGDDLIKYTAWGLSLDEWGSAWFLSPNKVTGELEEIWPIRMGALRPVKHRTKFISHYVYTGKTGDEVKIRPEYICRFIYSNPFDLWRSYPPLEASGLVMNLYEGITTAQRDLFTNSRGTPLSILSLDANISDPDFARARQVIHDDWQNERKIAIVRAGSLEVDTVGLSNKDLEVIATQEFTRDELDAIFMGGIQWRKDTSGDELEEVNKSIKEIVIYPLHNLIAKRINLSILNPFYGSGFFGEFDDVRAQDRSLSLQERTIYFRSMKYNETREELGLPPFDNDLFPDYGELPYVLANDSSFISTYYGIGDVAEDKEEPEDIGNVAELLDPEAQVNQLAGGEMDVQKAAVKGLYEELKNYEKVLKRSWRKHEDTERLIEYRFDSDIVPGDLFDEIKAQLAGVQNEDDIITIFNVYFD